MAIRKRKKMPPSLTPTGALNKQAAKMVAAAEQAVSSLRNKMFGDMYLHAIRQHVSGNSVPLKFLKELREIPVSIETFIDSPDFFGATDLVLWPEVRKAIVDINSRWWKGPKDAYTEVVLMGATSTGKSEIAKVTTAYHIYLLGCMKAPQQYYGLPQATSIVFMIQAAKTHVTKKVIYMPLRNYIETMPWFQRHMRPDRLLEAEMYFPELNVRVVQGGADSDTVLGEAIIGGIIDEINFMNVVTKSKKAAIGTGRSGTYDQAQSVYDTITRRRKGRFLSLGPQIGTICVASSTRYKGDFTDRRKQHVEDNKIKTVYIYDRAQYDVWPQDRYSGEKFRLLVANESAMDIRILEDNEKALGCTVLEIPVEYIDDFRRDPAGSLRDVVGSSVNSINPFFRQQNKIMDCVAMGEHTGLATFLQKDNVVLGFEGLPVPVRGHYCKNPSKPRYVHIDLSSTSDRCGVAMLRVDGMEWVERLGGEPENLPIASVEMAVTFEPDHGNEIDIAEVRSWVRMLKTQYGYPIRAVTYDGWNCQSVASDVWTSRGLILAGEVKVGDVVQTRSGPQPVEKVWRYGKAPTLVVNTKQGHTYEITHGHKLEILDRWDWSGPRNDRKPVWGWCRADQIQEGDIVRTWDGSTEVDVIDFYPLAEVPDHFASNSNPMLYQPAVLNENVARFIGLMFGDGNFNKVSLTLTCTEEDCDNAYSIITSAVDLESYGAWSPIKGANVGKIQIGSSHLLEWLRHNRLADKTGVPEAIRRSPLSVQAAFISGLFSADGSVKERDGQVSIEQRNENYIKYLMHILSMGFGMRVNKTYRSPRVVILPQGREYKTKGSYILQIQGSRKCFYERIGFAYDSKQRQLFTHLDVPGRFIYSKVASITESMAEVVDFQIAEDHSYLANGFVSHNSLESRQAWKKQGMKTAAVSVDRSDVPYKQLRDAIYDNRLRLYHQPILIEELFGLEYDEKDKKIDHPVNGGKDCADAVCGAYYTLLTRSSSWVMAGGSTIGPEEMPYDDRPDLGDRFEPERA